MRIVGRYVLNASVGSGSASGPLVLAVTVVCIMIAVVAAMYEKGKHSERRQWAENRGFGFMENDKELGKRTARLFKLSRTGLARDIIYIPTSVGNVLYYELFWTVYVNGGTQSRVRAFLRYPLPGPLPCIHIKPEGVFGLANNDVNTEWQAFNKEFDVKTDDGRVSRALLTRPMQEFLMNRMRGERLAFGGDGVFLFFKRYDPEDTRWCVDLMKELVDYIPPALFGKDSRFDLDGELGRGVGLSAGVGLSGGGFDRGSEFRPVGGFGNGGFNGRESFSRDREYREFGPDAEFDSDSRFKPDGGFSRDSGLNAGVGLSGVGSFDNGGGFDSGVGSFDSGSGFDSASGFDGGIGSFDSGSGLSPLGGFDGGDGLERYSEYSPSVGFDRYSGFSSGVEFDRYGGFDPDDQFGADGGFDNERGV